MYSGNDNNTSGSSFIINRTYKQAIMNFEAVYERICSLRMKGKFCNFTIISVPASMEENLWNAFTINLIRHIKELQHDTKITVGDFMAKIGRKEVFRPFIENCMKHQMKMGPEKLILTLIII
jgi:hypothetical protein